MRARGAGRDGSGLPNPRVADPMLNPEVAPVFAVFSPLMKIPSGPCPLPVTPGGLAALLPGDPGCGPSGEMEIRADRFPAGIAGGGARVGVAESAINVVLLAVCAAISGAAEFRSPRSAAARGTDIGLTGTIGLGGACAEAAMLIAPICFSGAARSGAEASGAARREGVLGRMAVSTSLGRAGWAFASCTILGSAGKSFGRLLRNCWLNQSLPRMRRVQRRGEDRLPGMKGVGTATGLRLSKRPFWALISCVARQAEWPENRARGRTRSVPFAEAERRRAEGGSSRSAEEIKSEAPAAQWRLQTPALGNADRSSSRESMDRQEIFWEEQAPEPEP